MISSQRPGNIVSLLKLRFVFCLSRDRRLVIGKRRILQLSKNKSPAFEASAVVGIRVDSAIEVALSRSDRETDSGSLRLAGIKLRTSRHAGLFGVLVTRIEIRGYVKLSHFVTVGKRKAFSIAFPHLNTGALSALNTKYWKRSFKGVASKSLFRKT